jgi:trigger factor
MKSSIKNLTDTKVEITITLDAKELAIAQQVATTKLARDVKVSGFRKGKAPLSVAVKSIDPKLLDEQIMDNAISKSVATVFTESKLQVLDRPAVAVKKFVPGEMMEFTAEAEILPAVKLGNYQKLKLTTEKVTVTESEVNETIDRIRQSFAEKKDVKRPAKDGDETIIDFVGKLDGVAFDGGTGNDFNLTLGSNQFIPGFEKGIIGHKIGDKFDLKLTFPSDYQSVKLQGAKVVFSVNLKSVKELALPEMDDKLAAKSGPFTTMAELKSDIKRELTAQKQREVSERQKDDLVKQLVAISNVPVPEILVIDQSKSIEQDFTSNLMYQGLSLDQYLENKGFESKEKWLETEVHEVAVKRVQAGLVLSELSRVEKVEMTNAEIDNQVAMFKQQYANNVEALKQFEKPEVRRDIANRLLTDKTVDILVKFSS